MKQKVFLYLAIALAFADILFLLAGQAEQRLDYAPPLLSINGFFSLYVTAASFLAAKNRQSSDKLPLPVSIEAPALQFSDQLLARHFPDLLCLKDKDGRWLIAAPSYLAAFGLSDSDYFGKTDIELAQVSGCHVAALQAGAAEDKKCWKQGLPVQTLRPISPELTIEETRTPVFDLGQNRFRLIITGRPASEFDKKRKHLVWLERAWSHAHIAFVVLDQDFHLLECNRAFDALTGFQPGELTDKSLALIFAGSDAGKTLPKPNGLFDAAAPKYWTQEFECLRKGGPTFPARIEMTAIEAGEHQAIHYFASLTDISGHKQIENRIRQISLYDELTGLCNRQLFFDRLGQFLSTSGRYRLHAVLLHIDLDRFKSINESLGHNAGDELLKQAGERLSNTTRKGDVLARLSSDEFALLLLNDKDHDRAVYAASLVAKKVIQKMSNAFYIQSKEVFVGASIGIAMFPEDGSTPEALLKHADFAMHEAKNGGRNNYQFYRKDFTAATKDRLSMEMGLRKAIARNELQLYYQPQYLAVDRMICGAEVLIRWFQRDNGQTKMVPPNFFIPVAEESGLIVEIGTWILRAACAQIKNWQEAGIPMPQVSVNISARQFIDPNFLQIVEDALSDCGLAAEHLELEITESMLIGDIKRIELQLKRLKKMGIRVALDDFGTGYSSLSYLKNFPVDVLKIDQSFIREMTHDSRDRNIASAIIQMGHSLGQKIVAEGVETEEQLRYLVGRKCDIIQGYFFSPPVPGNQMTELLHQQKDRLAKVESNSLLH